MTKTSKAYQMPRKTKKQFELFCDFVEMFQNPLLILKRDEKETGSIKHVYANQAFTDTFGYTIEEIPNAETLFKSFFPDESYREYIRKVWYESIEDARCENRRFINVKTHIRCKDGSLRWFSTTTQSDFVVLDEYRVDIFIETHDLETIEKKFFNTSYQYRMLLKSLGAYYLFFDYDKAGYLRDVSDSIEAVLGYPKEEIIGTMTPFVVESSLNKEVNSYFEKTVKGQMQKPYELECIHKDGSQIILEVTQIPSYDEDKNLNGVIGIARNITNQVLLQRSLKQSRDLLRTIMNNIPAPIFYKDKELVFQGCNDSFCMLFDTTRENVLGKHLRDFLPDVAKHFESFDKKLLNGESDKESYSSEVKAKDGTTYAMEFHKSVLKDDQGIAQGIVGFMIDMTQEKQMQESIRKQKEFLQSVLESIHEPILVFNNQLDIELQNSAAQHWKEKNGTFDSSEKLLREVFDSEEKVNEMRLITSEEGMKKYYDVNITPLYDAQKEVQSVIEVMHDITAYIKTKSELEEQKIINEEKENIDSLTKLMSKSAFIRYVEKEVVRCRQEHLTFAMVYLDLDNFKSINDSFGHSVGDKAIKEVAKRFRTLLPKEYKLAHLGADEFATLIVAHTSNEINSTVKKLQSSLDEPLQLKGNEIYISCSVGVSIFPQNGQNAEALLKNADAALYKAKADGRNTYHFYTTNLTELAQERLRLGSELRHALTNNEFELYYQPQVCAKRRSVVGFEALIRWNHPEKGIISPVEFIPTSQELGLVDMIDYWVLNEATMQAVSWIKEGLKPGKIAINFSSKELQLKESYEKITGILEKNQCEASFIEVEVTEGFIMKHPSDSIALLNSLKNRGFEISIDDFGTGYSSMAYLKRLPIDKLKIDKSFVDAIVNDEKDHAICKAIIVLAKALGMTVIAEGVEHEEQYKVLKKDKCDQIQGHYFYKPMPADEAGALLKKQNG